LLFPPYNRLWFPFIARKESVDKGKADEFRVFRSGGAERIDATALPQLLYCNWRPTLLGGWVNRFMGWWSELGLPPNFQAALEVQGRKSGRTRSNPVVIATVGGKPYLVSMLGPESDWVKNVEAARGDAVIRQGRRRRVQLVEVLPEQRTHSPRVCANRTQRPTALSAPSRRTPVRRRGDCRAISRVPDRSLMRELIADNCSTFTSGIAVT
jgi:deazaflavin-dependent oxidoreductase (nitroreductase family)